MRLFKFLIGLLVFNLLSCGEKTSESEKSSYDNAPVEVSQKTANFICDVNYEHSLIIRTTLLEKEKSVNGLLAFRDSVNEGSLYEAYVTYRIGAHYGNYDPDSTRYYYLLAIEQFKKLDTVVVERIGRIYNNLASATNSDYEKLQFAKNGIDALQKQEGTCSYNANLPVELHRAACDALTELKDIGNALKFARNGIQWCLPNTANYVKGTLYTSYANALIQAGKLEQAQNALDTAVAVYTRATNLFPEDYIDFANVYDAYQRLYSAQGNEMSAMTGNEKALGFRIDNQADPQLLAHSYNNLGRLYYLNGRTTKGRNYLHKALKLYSETGNWIDRGTSFESLALGELTIGDTLTALAYLDSAASAYHGIPEIDDVTYALDPAEMRDPLMTKARLLTYLHASRPDDYPLTELQLVFARVDSLSDLLRFNVSTEESKRIVIKNLRSLYEAAIAVNLKQYERTGNKEHLDFALQYLEKGKARILRERRAKSLKSSNSPEAIAQNSSVSENILSLKGDIRNTKNTKAKKNLSIKLLKLRQTQRNSLKNSASSVNTADSAPHQQGLAVRKISPTLTKDEVVLDYFIGLDYVFVAVADIDSVFIKKLSVTPQSLNAQIDVFSSSVVAPAKTSWREDEKWRQEKTRELAGSSYSLYNALVAEVFDNGLLPQNLTIIPDGSIWKLPFGALTETLADPGSSFEDWKFLNLNHSFNYDFSTSMWLDRLANKRKSGTKMLVLAPEQNERVSITSPLGESTTLGPLAQAEVEVEAIKRSLQPEVWSGTEVAKFRSPQLDMHKYAVVHFSGHGLAYPSVPEESFLAFQLENGKPHDLFKLSELENRKLPIDLLVLSACQTGDGEIASAEGIISLGRAGAIAGANSVIVSYWNVSQLHKPAFFGYFYNLLQSGMSRSGAVHNAQALIRADSKKTSHPFYWAAFQNIGSAASVSVN